MSRMQKSILILLVCLSVVSPAWADCDNAEDCIKDGSFGIGKVNGSTRAIYYELQETNKLIRELIEEVRKQNGTFHSEHKQ